MKCLYNFLLFKTFNLIDAVRTLRLLFSLTKLIKSITASIHVICVRYI